MPVLEVEKGQSKLFDESIKSRARTSSSHLLVRFSSLEKNTLPKSKKKMSTHALIFFKEFDCIESSERGHNSVMSHSRNSLLNPNQTP